VQPVHTAASRRWIWVLPLLLLVIAIVAPPLINLNSLHRRIADSISRGIGRPVRMSSIVMRLLPRPGFEIADFVVEDDPAFGGEPILRSSQVTAYVRLLPLWRGRLEIARIAFDEPSLNLVRNRQGQWNFDSVLSQAAQIPKAPTGERHPGGLPRFPYIDASNARVNFKSGDEKLPFSFLNADLAVWLENPGEWRIQFAAHPVRTDLSLDLDNTGIFRLEGSLRRAAALRQMPVQLHAEWSNAPLGQLSRILAGTDPGWRGDLEATADIAGTMDHASLKLNATGQGIHRAEFEPREPMNLEVTCRADFTRAGRFFDAITCLTPTGDGHLLLTGSIHAVPAGTDPELSLEINHLPVSMAVEGLRLVRSGFAPAVQATGTVDGNFSYSINAPAQAPQIHGQATVNGVSLVAPEIPKPLALPALHFTTDATPAIRPRRAAALRRVSQPVSPIAEAALSLEPFSLGEATALPSALTVSGAFHRSGFSVHVRGQSHIEQIANLGKEFGLLPNRSVTFGPLGTAEVDLSIHGPWLVRVAEHPAALDGSIRLHNALLTAAFLAQPLEIGSAQAVLGDNRIDWTATAIVYGPVHADGTLSYPAFCAAAVGCLHEFTLRLATLDTAAAQAALLGSSHHGELVQRLLDRISPTAGGNHSWPALSGTVQIGTLTMHTLIVHDLAASLSVAGNTVQIGSLTGRALDGSLRLSGAIDLSGAAPRYEIEAKLDHASASSAAALFQEKWGPGSLSLVSKLQLSGFDENALASSAAGTFLVEWTKGGLPIDATPATVSELPGARTSPARSSFARFDSWVAGGTIAQSALNLGKSEIASGADVIPLTGTIDFTRELHLSSPSKTNPLKLTGTLEHPEVVTPPPSGMQ
jgi:uncharacterized protein involved in outer membrane biogenesis